METRTKCYTPLSKSFPPAGWGVVVKDSMYFGREASIWWNCDNTAPCFSFGLGWILIHNTGLSLFLGLFGLFPNLLHDVTVWLLQFLPPGQTLRADSSGGHILTKHCIAMKIMLMTKSIFLNKKGLAWENGLSKFDQHLVHETMALYCAVDTIVVTLWLILHAIYTLCWQCQMVQHENMTNSQYDNVMLVTCVMSKNQETHKNCVVLTCWHHVIPVILTG